MTTIIPAKSILKQPTTPKTTSTTTTSQQAKEKREKDKKNLNIALHHAYKIQNQKDTESQNLESIMTLMDFPSKTPFSGFEACSFLNLIIPFQPSDFDSLIEERRIDGKCGYVLCALPPRSSGVGVRLNTRTRDFCSETCARKAVYVRAQLSTIPAWERAPDFKLDIELHPDDHKSVESVLRRQKRASTVQAWRENVASGNAGDRMILAAERGEDVDSFRPGQVLSDSVIERSTRTSTARPPDSDQDFDAVFDAIEGHRPKRKDDAAEHGEESDVND